MHQRPPELDEFLDSLDELILGIKIDLLHLDSLWNNVKLSISNSASFDINRLRSDISGRLENLKNDLHNVGKPPDFDIKHPDTVFNDLKSKFNSLLNILGILPAIISDVTNMQLDQAKNLIKNIQDLNSNIMQGATDIARDISNIMELLREFQTLYRTIKDTLRKTFKSIKTKSALMDNDRLKKVLEDYIVNSFPPNTFPIVNGEIDPKALDKAIIELVKQKRIDNKKVPEFFVTGTNIIAKRSVAFSLAEDNTNEQIANRNFWLIKLDDDRIDMQKRRIKPPNEFVFGGKSFGEPIDHMPRAEIANNSLTIVLDGDVVFYTTDIARIDAFLVTRGRGLRVMNNGREIGSNESSITVIRDGRQDYFSTNVQEISTFLSQQSQQAPHAGDGRGRLAVRPMQMQIDNTLLNELTVGKTADAVTNHSLIVGSVLTSSTIPLAFPPRKWIFYSRTDEKYVHWMVDGGVVDNRPIDVAIKAGAEFIISFELTPLLSATRELKKIVEERPSFAEVISKSMVDATLNAAFYRYFEDLVTDNANNPNHPLTIYRVAPMMHNTPEDADYGSEPNWDEHTIGTYDFNGKYDKNRNFRMGLFDWFMKGYIDAKGGDTIDMNDPVNNAYNNLPEDFGAKRNAYEGRRSGFYEASLEPHPTTNPPW